MLRVAMRLLAFSMVAFGLVGCGWLAGGDDDQVPDPPPLPSVMGLESRVIDVIPGETVEIRVTMTDASGKPFEPDSFQVWGQIHRLDGGGGWSADGATLCDSPTVIDVPSEGQRLITFVAGQRGQCMIQARVKTCSGVRGSPCIRELSGEYGPVFVNVMGGDTDSIAPLQPSLTIVPGETRPVWAIPMMAPDKDGLRYPSGQPWKISVRDSAVAVVDGERRVKGVAPGTTFLDFQSQGVRTEIPVTVVQGSISAPPDGRHRLEVVDFDGTSDTGDIRGVPVHLRNPIFSHKHRLALDSRGWPSAVFEATAVAVQWNALLHMEWTGSGFGVQQIGGFRENLWQPQYAVDSNDVRYVVAQSSVMQGLHVAIQRPGEQPGTWSFMQIPRRHDMDAADADPLYWTGDHNLDMDRELMSILPRPGGGAWLAYLVWQHDATDPVTPCVRLLRLATMTPESVTVQEVEEFRFAEGVNGCEATAKINAFDVSNLLLLPPDPGWNVPKVLLTEKELNRSWSYPFVYQTSGGAWQRSEWPLESLDDGLSDSYKYPFEVTVPRPTPAGAAASLIWSMNLDVESDGFDLAHFGWGFGDGPFSVCFCDPGDPVELFGLQIDGNVWVGDGNLSPLVKFSRNGRMSYDRPELLAPIDGQTDEFVGMNRVYGWVADESRMTFLTNHSGYRLDLVTITPPKVARDAAADIEGARLGDVTTAEPLSMQPVALADGTIMMDAGARYDELDKHSLDSLSALYMAEPPKGQGGAVWTKAMTAQPQVVFEAPRQFFQVASRPGTVFGLMREANTGTDLLVESSDGGSNWTNRRQLAGYVFKAVQVGDGLAFVTHQPVQGADGGRPTEVGIWYLADMTVAEPQPVELAPRIPVPANLYSTIKSCLNILPMKDGFMVISSLDDAWRSGELDIRRFDASGNLVDSNVTGVRQEMELDVSTAVLAGSEQSPVLVMLRIDAKGPGIQYTAHYSSDLFRDEAQAILPSYWEPPMVPVRLDDGRVAFMGTMNAGADLERAAWTVSADGVSWSEPALIRPEGGYDQEIWGATATPDGRVVVIVGDNELMRAGGNGIKQTMNGVALRLAPPSISD